MAIGWLDALAAKAPVPVYPVIGPGTLDDLQTLRLDSRLEWVQSPRHARLLLVAGGITPDFTPALRRLHAQVPSPRTTLWWRCPPLPELTHESLRAESIEQIAPLAQQAYRAQLQTESHGEPELCADCPPAPWEGLGDHGQGGEGMMGGTPYGRPMAMTDDDLRDGLALDPLTFSIGPFWSVLPPGLSARVTLHGDVIADFQVLSSPYPIPLPAIFHRALHESVSITELEMARAGYHLHRLSHVLWVNGFDSASLAVLRKVRNLKPGDSLKRLRRWLLWSGFFASAGAGKGRLNHDQATKIGGPAARTAGIDSDARQDDPRYQALGFTTASTPGGGCEARWHRWLTEAEQALMLAGKATKSRAGTENRDSVETPRGRLGRNGSQLDATSLLAEILPGLEWHEAMAVIASLDLAAIGDFSQEGI